MAFSARLHIVDMRFGASSFDLKRLLGPLKDITVGGLLWNVRVLDG